MPNETLTVRLGVCGLEEPFPQGPVDAGFARTPFGTCLAAEGRRGILRLEFIENRREAAAWRRLKAEWAGADVRRNDKRAAALVKKIFSHKKHDGPFQVCVRGTPFQIRVWKELMKIPRGERISYGALARAVGRPKAARAAGSAAGKNPAAFLVPCHRVVREDGSSGGYRWGAARKQKILDWEKR